MSELAETVGENVLRIRKYFRFTQHELGQAIGYTAVWISQIERGLVSARIDTLAAIAEAFGMAPDILLRKDGYLEITQGRARYPVLHSTRDRQLDAD